MTVRFSKRGSSVHRGHVAAKRAGKPVVSIKYKRYKGGAVHDESISKVVERSDTVEVRPRAPKTGGQAERPRTDEYAERRRRVIDFLNSLEPLEPPRIADLDLSEPGELKIKKGRERRMTFS